MLLENNNGEMFEEERLRQFVKDNKELKAVEFNGKLLEFVDEFKESQAYVDDISLLTCRFS